VKLAESSLPGYRWVIAGEARGPDNLRHLRLLKGLIAEEGLEKTIIFSDFVTEGQLECLRQNAVAFVHTAITEGYGLVLLEAMKAGAPVIASAADGPATIINNLTNGILTPVRDSPELAAAMIRLAKDKGLRSVLIKNGRSYVREHGPEKMTRETAECYRAIFDDACSRFPTTGYPSTPS
jgi:glycosyltransferase involved in cell wall biosynthesis